MNIKGKTALVTGGAHRVGKAIAMTLADRAFIRILRSGSAQVPICFT